MSLVTNDSYSLGALALGRSLRDSMTSRTLSLLITKNVSLPMRSQPVGQLYVPLSTQHTYALFNSVLSTVS